MKNVITLSDRFSVANSDSSKVQCPSKALLFDFKSMTFSNHFANIFAKAK